jgi:putative transposase
VKHAFIRHHLAGNFPLRVCCRVLGVSASGYYHALDRPISARRLHRLRLAEEVRTVHQQTRGVYGSPRVCRALQRSGVSICRNTAATLMRESGLRSRRCRRFRPRTTDSSRTIRPAPNLLRQMPAPDRPGKVWVADITYIAIAGGFVYLAAVMDLGSRRIVGWTLGESLHVGLVRRALLAGIAGHPPSPGLVHHSDRGSQYDSLEYRSLLRGHGIVQSMSRRGDCYDNAAMESFFATLKTELIGVNVYPDHRTAHDQIFRFIEGFYNTHRLHSALNYTTPNEAHIHTL